jgi:hypothetical protein
VLISIRFVFYVRLFFFIQTAPFQKLEKGTFEFLAKEACRLNHIHLTVFNLVVPYFIRINECVKDTFCIVCTSCKEYIKVRQPAKIRIGIKYPNLIYLMVYAYGLWYYNTARATRVAQKVMPHIFFLRNYLFRMYEIHAQYNWMFPLHVLFFHIISVYVYGLTPE